MIQATELRIGNWVYAGDKITLIYIDSVCEWGERPLYGIPLTPEILEKCGLKLNVYGHNGDREVSSCDLGCISILDTMEVWVNNEEVSHIKHLHQLQNLYFALTGKELEVKMLSRKQSVQESDTTKAQ
jgi:hypothetical protein